MITLNDYQKKAAEFQGKHLLVLAGAGTGKTKTIIVRAEFLIKSGVQPKKIAVLSFTRKSAQEIVERVKSSVSGPFNAGAISGRTFHSWCNEIMHTYPDYFPQSKYTLLDEDDRISAMGLAVGKQFKDSQGEKLKAATVVAIYSYAVNTLCKLSEAIKHLRYCNSDKGDEELKIIIENDRALIGPVIQKYIDYKVTRRYVDYDDMLNIVADALQKNEVIRKAVTKRWEHILVDEMQDTNPLQYKLLQSFIEHSKLFCVGDDAQSIYAFRGADFKTIHSFTANVPDSEAQKLILNYRSTQEILDLSNWLLEQSPLTYDKKLEASRGQGNKPKIIHTENDWEEANIITDDIIRSVNENDCSYSDSMVLGRSSWALSRVEGACLQKKIPYIKLGGTQLMQSAHVRDVASGMRVVANNYDEIAWIRFLQLWDGIGEVSATKIISDILTLSSFVEILRYLRHSKYRTLIHSVPDILEVIHEHINSPANAIREAVDSMNDLLSKRYKEEWTYRITDFEVLEEVAKSTGSISEFITEYVLDPRADTTLKIGKEIDKDVVTLSTIHSAKGLESKIVHITNVNPYTYPSTRTIKEGEDAVEEERRCLYVAMTRAKDHLKLYRNVRSLHTQFNKNEEAIHLRGTYKSKTPDEQEVLVINSQNESVTVFNKKNKRTEVIPRADFNQKFVEVGKQELSLYFLNELPTDLVEIVVPERENVKPEPISEKTDPATLPDFNFD
ncbi:ATP-dependent helicase [Salinimicrobium flavum]|uniref:DNA 3'-5' helicase n=1 Tax=Salinimicrobium flavum TaxID=1737065 RepID=A0ABW5IX64_9FLAO